MKALWNVLRAGSGQTADAAGASPRQGTPGDRNTATDDEPAASEPSLTIPVPDETPPDAIAAADSVPPETDPAQGSITLDRDWKIKFINAEAAAVFGYTAAELMERSVQTLIPQGLAAQTEPARPGADGERDEWVIGRSKDGRRFPLQFVASEPDSGAGGAVALVLRRSHELEKQADAVRAVSPQREALEAELTNLRRSRQEADARLAALESALATTEAQHTRVLARLETAHTEIAQSARALEAAQAGLEEQRGQVAALSRALDEGGSALADARAQVATLAGTVGALEAQLATARAETDAAVAERGRLSAELDTSRPETVRHRQEAEALRSAIGSVSQELASARVVLTTLHHERDGWQAREAQARAEAESLALALARGEREAAALRAALHSREQDLAQLQQHEHDSQQALQAAELRLATETRALTASRRETEAGEHERERLAVALQQELRGRTQAEQEVQALSAMTTDISRELAAARVVVETLRQERDLWQAQASAARTDLAAAQEQLAAARRSQIELEQATQGVCSTLRQNLTLAAAELVPRVTELQTTLARRELAEAQEAEAHAAVEAASARGLALEAELRQQLAAPLSGALEGLCRALAGAASGRAPTAVAAPPGTGAAAPINNTPEATA